MTRWKLRERVEEKVILGKFLQFVNTHVEAQNLCVRTMLEVRFNFPGRLNLYSTIVDIAQSRLILILVRGQGWIGDSLFLDWLHEWESQHFLDAGRLVR